MRGTTIPVLRTASLTAAAMAVLTALLGGFGSARAVPSGPASLHGHEVIRIIDTRPGPRHAKAFAKGAFRATGFFVRAKASLIFPKGKLVVRRHVTSSSVTPPKLSTCRFSEEQAGTFSVSHATGAYQGHRFSGTFSTRVSGRLQKTGHNQCGSKIVTYRAVVTETGTIP